MDPFAHPIEPFQAGLALLSQGQPEPAIAAFERCLASVPDHPGALYNLGTALLQAGRDAEALAALFSCLGVAPDFGKAYVNIADLLRRFGLFADAQAMAECGVRLLPNSAEAKICLAHVLTEKTQYQDAAALYRQILEHSPDHAGAHSNCANILLPMGHAADALAMHDRAVTLDPTEPRLRFNRAIALLQMGSFTVGWDEFEARLHLPRTLSRGFGDPWTGSSIAGRIILLHAEQGLGDTLQFIRYAPMVAERGAQVVLEVQPPLVRLMRQMPGITRVMAQGDVLPPFDVHCPLMSLPKAFATTLDTIPATIPYLVADQRQAARWATKLPMTSVLRVGLVWAGAPRPEDPEANLTDKRRSLALQQLAPLAQIANVHFISLQKDRPPVPPPDDMMLVDLMPEVADFADTAALVANLDLVIAVDTSVAHLAGAMAKPVWLLCRYDTCWRWLHRRHDSPWYPTMRIYQQERPHDWPGVVKRVKADLTMFAKAHAGAALAGRCHTSA